MPSAFSIMCMMCGRMSGQVRNGVFNQAPDAPTLGRQQGRTVCGYCGGNVYLEHDDSPLVGIGRQHIPAYRQRRAS